MNTSQSRRPAVQQAATWQALTHDVLAQFAKTPDPRLRELVVGMLGHLHAFVEEVKLSPAEWTKGVEFLTRLGQACSESRQEVVLLSDVLGLSMLIDLVEHPAADGSTETTVLGPFYVPNSPARADGASTAERPSGVPCHVSGRVLDQQGAAIAGAEIDVWQNGVDTLYAVQDPTAPPGNLRGRFTADTNGGFSFVGVRPVDYPVPTNGPVGDLLRATAREPWRAAHLHLIVRARGYRTVTTHLFDDESPYLDRDVVFGVKSSLVRHFTAHRAGESGRPDAVGTDEPWYSLEHDIVLATDAS